MNAETKISQPLVLDARPRSAVSTAVGLIGLAILFVWTAVSRSYGMAGPLAALTALGCTHVQGFLLGRPLPAAQATALLLSRGGCAPG